MKKTTKKIIVLTAIAALCLTLIICASVMLPHWQSTIDKFFLGQGIDTSDYNAQESKDYSVKIEDEGQVLLKNENSVLPLKATADSPAKVSVFGIRAGNMKFTGSGSGGGDVTDAIQLDEALAESNIRVFGELFDYYQKFDSTKNEGGFGVIGKDPNSAEIGISTVDKAILERAKAYSSTAIYVIGRVGAEEGNLTADDLCLSVYEEETLDYITENYEDVIVILNVSNAWEAGFIEGKGISRNSGENFKKYEGKIDAALWVGCPGLVGSLSIGRVLAGTVNPSGRLVDTYSFDNMNAPAAHNVAATFFSDSSTLSYSSYVEGIYTGYKWYETAAYEKAIDYDDYSGASALAFADGRYSQGVLYPFGYGLSYTNFTWTIEDTDVQNGTINIKVKVHNDGDVAGKDVVEAYFTPPYNDGGIEKAYVNLIDFEKTDLIEPGGEDIVTLSFDVEDMKSYDYSDADNNGFKGYELEAGRYYIRLLKNAHDWVNVGVDDDLCYTYVVDKTVNYELDSETNNAVVNQFGNQAGGIEYLSRENSFANLACARVDSARKTTDFCDENGNTDYVSRTQRPYKIPEDEINDYEQYVDYEATLNKTVKLKDMREEDYDSEKWNLFVSQLTKSEMCTIIAKANFETIEVERLGIPYCLLSDGPSGIKSTYEGDSCVCFPSAVALASTWNKELARGYGERIAKDASVVGVSCWYAPSVNLHRTAFDSRCFEYYSECAVLTGKMAANVVAGAEENGLNCTVKHLILYGNGIFQWCNEQAIREYYLLPFEKCIKDGGALSLMTTSKLFGQFCGKSAELLTNVIRGEWGFKGFITTDASASTMEITESIRAGNDLWLASDTSFYKALIKDKNIGVMKEAVKHYLYAVSRSDIAMNGTVVSASWSPSMLAMALIDVFTGLGLIYCLYSMIMLLKKRRKNED